MRKQKKNGCFNRTLRDFIWDARRGFRLSDQDIHFFFYYTD